MAMADDAPGCSRGLPLLEFKSTRDHGEMGKRKRKRRGTRFEGSPAAAVLGMAGIRTAADGVLQHRGEQQGRQQQLLRGETWAHGSLVASQGEARAGEHAAREALATRGTSRGDGAGFRASGC